MEKVWSDFFLSQSNTVWLLNLNICVQEKKAFTVSEVMRVSDEFDFYKNVPKLNKSKKEVLTETRISPWP